MQQLHGIQQALGLIERRLNEPLRLESLARAAGMSLWHFQRTFAAMVGQPAGSYLRQRRIAEAAWTLRASRCPILEVALDYQFESHEAFTRAFKAETGATPSAWRAGPAAPLSARGPFHLTPESIRQRYHHMNLKPEITRLPARTFAGLPARFITIVSPDANNLEVIPRLWAEFGPRMHELRALEPGVRYGLTAAPASLGEKPSHPDEAIYLAAVPVEPKARLPRGMTAWKSLAGTYAKFSHVGRIGRIGETYGFIYGRWLPEGGYERANGPDFERYDRRFDPQSAASVLEIFVPVRTRKR